MSGKKGRTWVRTVIKLRSLGISPDLPQRVAYTIFEDEEGNIEFDFRGINKKHITKIFEMLSPSDGKGIFKSFLFDEVHDRRYKYGHGYWRIRVPVFGYNPNFASMQSVCMIIEHKFLAQAVAGSTIKRFKPDEYLNLTGLTKKQQEEYLASMNDNNSKTKKK